MRLGERVGGGGGGGEECDCREGGERVGEHVLRRVGGLGGACGGSSAGRGVEGEGGCFCCRGGVGRAVRCG